MSEVSELDQLLIQQVCAKQINKFAKLNDAHDHHALVELFAPDGEFARPSLPDDVIVGRPAILEAFQKRPPRKSVHLVSNIIVDVVSSTEATASSLITLYSAAEGATVAEQPFLIGGFNDKLVLTDGKWLFASRRGRIELKVDK